MLNFIDPDPAQAILKIGVGVLAIVLLTGLGLELRHRSRRYGGGDLGAALMFGGVIVLLVGITPNLFPFDIGLMLMLVGMMAIYRPAMAVKLTGGPNLRWRALKAGRELLVLVEERGGPVAAAGDADVQAALAALDAVDGPETADYIGLVRDTALKDPARPSVAEKLARLPDADAALRATMADRPAWERALARRAAGEPPEKRKYF